MGGNFTAFVVYRAGDAAALGEVDGAVGSDDVRFANVNVTSQADLLQGLFGSNDAEHCSSTPFTIYEETADYYVAWLDQTKVSSWDSSTMPRFGRVDNYTFEHVKRFSQALEVLQTNLPEVEEEV